MPKNINTRIQNKHDLEANWLKASGFIPLVGELIVYDAETQATFDAAYATLSDAQKAALGRTAPITHVRAKIGDGKTSVSDLAFLDAHLIEAIRAIDVPTKVSELENDSGFIKTIPSEYVTDSELADYAKKSDIPAVPVKSVNNKTGAVSLTASDVNALPNTTTLADLTGDDSHRTVTDTEKATWNAKSNFSGNYNDLTNKPTGLATETYADNAAQKVKDDLLNGAGSAYDTLKELGELIDENVDAIEALESVAAGKADKEHTHPELMSVGTADPDEDITSQFYFKYSTN